MKKVISFAASPQNLLKVSAVDKAFKKYRKEVKHLICHAGYEQEEKKSLSSFEDIVFPRRHYYVSVGYGSHAAQTARTMLEVEKILIEEQPDLVLLSGYQDAALAFGITASKMKIPIAHMDAGLRSFEKHNPAEINRMLTDVLCDFYFVSEHSAMKNLRDAGLDNGNINYCGNPLVDTIELYWSDMEESDVLKKLNITDDTFVLATFHQSENLRKEDGFDAVFQMLSRLSKSCKVVWVLPDYEYNNFAQISGGKKLPSSLLLSSPLPYTDFLALMNNAEVVITDTESIQEESTYLSAQCLTVKKYTERIVTLEVGTNQLMGLDFEKTEKTALEVINGNIKPGRIPELWDGKAARRIVDILFSEMQE